MWKYIIDFAIKKVVETACDDYRGGEEIKRERNYIKLRFEMSSPIKEKAKEKNVLTAVWIEMKASLEKTSRGGESFKLEL